MFQFLWNHLFGCVHLYWFRHLVVRHLYGLRTGRSNIHRAVTLLSPWLIRIGDNVTSRWAASWTDVVGSLSATTWA